MGCLASQTVLWEHKDSTDMLKYVLPFMALFGVDIENSRDKTFSINKNIFIVACGLVQADSSVTARSDRETISFRPL